MNAPLRFLAVAIVGWVGLRVWMLMPEASIPRDGVAEAPAAASAPAARPAERAAALLHRKAPYPEARPIPARPGKPSGPISLAAVPQPAAHPLEAALPLQARPQLEDAGFAPPGRLPGPDRWSASAWLLVRGDHRSTLAAAGTLGGSQAGFRLGYRLSRPLAVSARIAAPLRNGRGAEVALGLEWRPLPALPVALLAERRQAIGREGRDAFALTIFGGISQPLGRGLLLDAFAQGGIVGARSRDLFADGGARLGVPIGGIEIGAALSGGAQPGLARLDLGPQATLRLPVAGERLRLTAEWRFRVAGEARPGSGPALTLASDF